MEIGEGVTKTEKALVFTLQETGYFSFSPSPISLPNNGGRLQLLDADNQILSDLTYPKAASRSTKNYEEREMFAWDDDTQSIKTINIRAPQAAGFTHSRGQKNPALPTDSSRFKALINEVSVDHDQTDFIEIFIPSGPDKINLQYTEIKHNGTPLWYFDQPYFVEVGDYLIFKVGTPDTGKAGENRFHSNKREGLSGGSGTVEIIAHSGTSQETWLDVLCWQKSDLSQSESKRVQKFRAAQAWHKACVSIADLIPNESIARPPSGQDRHTSADWFRHFNGSMGDENVTQNQAPTAVITLQGTKRSVATVPFLLNPTGENSTDPDGPKDLKSFHWALNGTFISDQINPPGFYLETVGEHTLTLAVTDHAGAVHTTAQTIVGQNPVRRNTNKGSAEARLAVVQAQLKSMTTLTQKNDAESNDFFAAYIHRPGWQKALLAYNQAPIKYPNYKPQVTKEVVSDLYETDWPRHINLPKPVRHRLKKNLGLLFSWRESPWPGLAAEWTGVVEADRNLGYFDLVYRGF
jgi:hypothetical protein